MEVTELCFYKAQRNAQINTGRGYVFEHNRRNEKKN